MKTNQFGTFSSAAAAFLVVWLVLAANGIRASIIAAPYCPQFCECGLDEKGISWANCSRVLPERIRFPDVQRLTVVPDDGVALDENSVLHYIPIVFPKLKDLHVARCGLTHLSHSRFKQLGSLREIDLSANRLSEFSSHLFFSNQKLVYVNLQSNPLKVAAGRPFLVSNSIVELDLSRCNLTVVAPDAFSALPALRYLHLGHNRLTTVHGRQFPVSLSALDLSHNLIRNVPIAELMQLKQLREIDLSENPINCTCELIGFQNWISGQGVIFLNDVICSTPSDYRGWRLLDVPHYNLCEVTVIENPAAGLLTSGSIESCDEDHACDNIIVPNAHDLLSLSGRSNRKRSSALDEGPDAIYENDEMLPVQKRASKRDSQNKPPSTEDEFEGSGDDSAGQNTESTEVLVAVAASSPPTATDEKVAAIGREGITTASPTTTQQPQQPSPVESAVAPVSGSASPSSDGTAEEPKSAVTESGTVTPQTDDDGHRMKIDGSLLPSSTEIAPAGPSSTEIAPIEPSTNTTEDTKLSEPVAVKESDKAVLGLTPPIDVTEADAAKPTAETTFKTDIPRDNEPAEQQTDKPTSNGTIISAAPAPDDLATTTEAVNKTEDGGPFGQPHTGEQERINLFGFGLTYIIPCVVVIAFMLVCVAVYASQRRKSFRKNWSLEDSNRQNEGGTELQDISLLSDVGKGNIVKRANSKYPNETESEQTVRLMTPPSPDAGDEQSKACAPTWQSDSLPPANSAPSNGQVLPSSTGTEEPDSAGEPLPNGETLPKTAPIAEPEDDNDLQLTKAKVTVLPDSIPKTAVIINRNSTIDDAD